MPVDPKTTAVVRVEYQNGFTSEGGTLHSAVRDVMEQTGMIANTCKLVETARLRRGGNRARPDHRLPPGRGSSPGTRTGFSRLSSIQRPS